MSELSQENISHLGHLARLDLTQEELTRYAGQISSIVEYVEQLSQVPVAADLDNKGVTGLVNILAADLPRAQNDPAQATREEILQGAPLQKDGFFVVRAVMAAGEAEVS